jgi:hypothetical protein
MTLPDTAFYGEYEAIINGQDYDFNFNSATGSYVVTVPEPTTFGAAVVGCLMLFRRPRKRARDRFASVVRNDLA